MEGPKIEGFGEARHLVAELTKKGVLPHMASLRLASARRSIYPLLQLRSFDLSERMVADT